MDKPTVSYEIDQEMTLLHDRLSIHGRKFRRAAYAAFNALLDVMEQALKEGKVP